MTGSEVRITIERPGSILSICIQERDYLEKKSRRAAGYKTDSKIVRPDSQPFSAQKIVRSYVQQFSGLKNVRPYSQPNMENSIK